MYERGLTIKQYEFLFTGPAQYHLAFVKALELLCEHCEDEMRFTWEFGLVGDTTLYLRVRNKGKKHSNPDT